MTTATLAPKAAMRRPVPLARQIRDWHAYLGALIAPTVLFFATTGVVQLWSLHEAHGGYTPPALLEKLGALHKDQKFAMGHHHEAPAAKPAAGAHEAAHAPEAPRPAILLLKAFFTAVATGLIVSTVAGIWMGLSQSPRRRTLAVLLLIGAATPAILAALSA
ncbi:MAG TPA: hypothetical protein VK801_05435 [Caulobacteraceae bacterium]|jgi:hypothetical protein|nr:hypothetical protein [Caulobacteraceae bacterium]